MPLRDYAISLLLALAVVLIYVQTARHQFVNLDDDEYVYDNPNIRDGLTPKTITWCFTAFYAANWHPLTWLSHALDIQLYRLWAPGHHITSVVLHIAVAISLYFLLKRLTGLPWAAALATALFAVHPLRVESVAWVSERKDLLSGLFFLLTLHAWLSYVKRPRPAAYAIVLALYALGLLCKPMLVTLPVILLLLDYWPLGRVVGSRWSVVGSKGLQISNLKSQISNPTSKAANSSPAIDHRPPATDHRSLANALLLLEKLPLLILAAASSLLTISAQQEAMAVVPLPYRISNALVTTAAYLGQTLWPSRLIPYYPLLPNGPPVWQVLAATLTLTAISAVAISLRRSHPYLIVGWLWYLIMLLPVIGLIQVGEQSGADRYTYLPLIGPTLAVVLLAGSRRLVKVKGLGIGDWGLTVQSLIPNPQSLALPSAMLLALLAIAAWSQTATWKNGTALWTHAIQARGENYFALNNLGASLFQSGNKVDALPLFRRSVVLKPDFSRTLANLGSVLADQGNLDEGIALLRQSLVGLPNDAKVHLRLAQALDRNRAFQPAAVEYKKAQELDPKIAGAGGELGSLLARQGQFAQALPYFSAAVAENRSPENLAALANALLKLGRTAEAFDLLNEAVKRNPGLAEAQFNLSLLLAGNNRRREAIDHLQQAIAADPSLASAQNTLAALLAADGKLADALPHFQKAVQLDPKNVLARGNLGRTLSRIGQHAAAIAQLRAAMELDPQQPQIATWLAWSLATAPDATLPNGQEALELAEKAVAATQGRDPAALDAMAAAQAELGQFPAAEHTAQQAQQLATSLGNQPLAAEIGQRVDLYRAKKVYRSR